MSIKLVVVNGRPQGKSLRFPRGEYVFGRGAECHVRPNSDWVSRQHCMLCVTPEVISVRDLGSRNGTLVNGIRVLGERCLRHGDHLQVGPLVFEVHIEESSPPREGPDTDLRRPPETQAVSTKETVAVCIDTAELPALTEADAPPPAPAPQGAPQVLPPASAP